MQERQERVGRAPALVKEMVRVVRQLGLPSPSGVTKLPLHRSRPVRMAVRHRDSGAFELIGVVLPLGGAFHSFRSQSSRAEAVESRPEVASSADLLDAAG